MPSNKSAGSAPTPNPSALGESTSARGRKAGGDRANRPTASPTPLAPVASVSRARGGKKDDPWPPPELTAVGRVARPHGIRGELRVYPYTRTAEELVEACPDALFLWTPRGGAVPVHVESLAVHQNIVLLALEEVVTREDADARREAFLCIRSEDRWALDDDEFYIDDLAGMELRDADTDALVGRVVRVTEGAAHDYLELDTPGHRTPVLVPFVRAFVVRVDPVARRIQVRLPEGLLEIDTLPAE